MATAICVSDSDGEELNSTAVSTANGDVGSEGLSRNAAAAAAEHAGPEEPLPKRQRNSGQKPAACWPLVRPWSHPVTVTEAGKQRMVPDADLPRIAPATVARGVLPAELADCLLDKLLPESQSWKPSAWIVHGQKGETPRASAEYWLRLDHAQSESGNSSGRVLGEPSWELRTASEQLEALVSRLRPRVDWAASLALANRYSSGQDCVGWHSDFLGTLGPRPVIVGLSLGATRLFRLRRDGATPAEGNVVVSIPMPHNTAVIMWDDCQESWQHCVPRQADSSVGRHRSAGLVRISLTFRMARLELANMRKNCNCGRPSALKCKAGRYYLCCSPMGASSQCGFWEPCAWAQAEADRLRREVEMPSVTANGPIVLD